MSQYNAQERDFLLIITSMMNYTSKISLTSKMGDWEALGETLRAQQNVSRFTVRALYLRRFALGAPVSPTPKNNR